MFAMTMAIRQSRPNFTVSHHRMQNDSISPRLHQHQGNADTATSNAKMPRPPVTVVDIQVIASDSPKKLNDESCAYCHSDCEELMHSCISGISEDSIHPRRAEKHPFLVVCTAPIGKTAVGVYDSCSSLLLALVCSCWASKKV